MNEELKHGEHDPELEFEHQDLRPTSVYAFLAGLALAGILVYFVLWGLYRFLDYYERTHQPPQNPLVQSAEDTRNISPQTIQKFPQPRLEKNERVEINDFRLKEEQTLNSYGWVDQKAGVVRIPIDRAMELVAQRGLSTTPKIGTIPPSEVNVVNQAAQRADVSNLPNQQKKKPK
jgi:hypothetical protein